MEVKQAANVLELIEFFAAQKRNATLAEISRLLSWPKSSAFKLLGTLSNRGYLYEPFGDGSYYPSPKWASLIAEISAAQPLPQGMEELLHTLAEATRETVVVGAISGQHSLFIAAIESPQAVRYSASIGKRVPLHATATGRALLSQLSPADRKAILRKVHFERYTPATLMSAEAIEKEIARSAARGWFAGAGEYTVDLGGIAVPLSFPHRPMAIMVGGPLQRIRPHYEAIAKLVTRKVREHFQGN